MPKDPLNLTGQRFDGFCVIERTNLSFKKSSTWLCKCDCGNVFKALGSNIKSGQTGSCGCKNRKLARARNKHLSPQWTGVGEIPGWFIGAAKANAKRRKIEWDLTKTEILEIFNEQGGRCAYTNLELRFSGAKESRHNHTASLDRIHSDLPYIRDNIQFVHKDINLMKGGLSSERFRELCKLVL